MRLKTAIAMQRCAIARDEAERRLAQAHGSLRALIG
jgi:N-acetylmuramic acid 6-phosphate (MurNAc-6-P) etherase